MLQLCGGTQSPIISNYYCKGWFSLLAFYAAICELPFSNYETLPLFPIIYVGILTNCEVCLVNSYLHFGRGGYLLRVARFVLIYGEVAMLR